jgi:hypothetical protein
MANPTTRPGSAAASGGSGGGNSGGNAGTRPGGGAGTTTTPGKFVGQDSISGWLLACPFQG